MTGVSHAALMSGFKTIPPAGLTVTVLAQVTTTSSDSMTTPSFTPANNSLLLIEISDQKGASATLDAAITDNLGAHLTYTQRAAAHNNSIFATVALIYTAPVVTGAAMTITFTSVYSIALKAMTVYQITGQNASPIGLSGTIAGTSRASSALNLALGGTTGAQSVVFGVSSVDTNTNTPGTGWTVDADTFVGNHLDYVHERRVGARTTCDWDDITSSFTYAAAALEIKAA